MTTQMHPHDARAAARLASYPNQLAEREAIAAVDQEVFDRVHLRRAPGGERATVHVNRRRRHGRRRPA